MSNPKPTPAAPSPGAGERTGPSATADARSWRNGDRFGLSHKLVLQPNETYVFAKQAIEPGFGWAAYLYDGGIAVLSDSDRYDHDA